MSCRYLKPFMSYRDFKRWKSDTYTHSHISGRQLKITFLDVSDYSECSDNNNSKKKKSRKYSFLGEEEKTNNPCKSFGLKFIPNQSDLFRFIPKFVPKLCNSSQSEKSFRSRLMQIGWKSVRFNPRLWKNPDQLFSANDSVVEIIQIENSVWIILTSDSFGLNRTELWFGLKISDWVGLIFKPFAWNEIEKFFRIDWNCILRNEGRKTTIS